MSNTVNIDGNPVVLVDNYPPDHTFTKWLYQWRRKNSRDAPEVGDLVALHGSSEVVGRLTAIKGSLAIVEWDLAKAHKYARIFHAHCFLVDLMKAKAFDIRHSTKWAPTMPELLATNSADAANA